MSKAEEFILFSMRIVPVRIPSQIVFLLSSVSVDVSGHSGSKALPSDSHFSY